MGYSAVQKEKFIVRRACGFSYEAIAGELNISRQTLQNWSKDLRQELENAKAFRLDALRSQYQMLQTHQVEAFGLMLTKIKDELAKRDLSEVPTHRLMDMLLKFTSAINEHSSPLEFTEEADTLGLDMLQPQLEQRPMP